MVKDISHGSNHGQVTQCSLALQADKPYFKPILTDHHLEHMGVSYAM